MDKVYKVSAVIIACIVLSSCIYQQSAVIKNNADSTKYLSPYSPSTTITFYTESPIKVIVSLFDMEGNPLDTLFNGLSVSGNNTITPNLNELPTGVYIYKYASDDTVYFKKMMLLK